MTTEHAQQAQENTGHTRRCFLMGGVRGSVPRLVLWPTGRAAAAAVGRRVAVLSGKPARYVPGTGTGGRAPLPDEHGFRFFPGFHRNLPDTMRRIPFPGNANGVHGHLRNATGRLREGAALGRKGLLVRQRHRTGHDYLSAIISEWDKSGILYGKTGEGVREGTRSSPSSWLN